MLQDVGGRGLTMELLTMLHAWLAMTAILGAVIVGLLVTGDAWPPTVARWAPGIAALWTAAGLLAGVVLFGAAEAWRYRAYWGAALAAVALLAWLRADQRGAGPA